MLEVIEHLASPDNMIVEVYRILKIGGYLIISTPNLGNWVNRLTMLLGCQPYNVEVSATHVFGVPYRKGVIWKAVWAFWAY